MNRSRQPKAVTIATIFTAVYYPNKNYDEGPDHRLATPLPLPLYRLWADRQHMIYRPMENMLGKAYHAKLATTTVG
jgi:hypothetical protein